MKKQRALVFFSSGLGDALLLVPLVNALRSKNIEVTAFFNSNDRCEQLFSHSYLFDHIILRKSKWQQLLFAMLHLQAFDLVFNNHQALSRFHLKCAGWLGKSIIVQQGGPLRLKRNKFKLVVPENNIHDALQNLRLFQSHAQLSDLDFNLHFDGLVDYPLPFSEPYLILQSSSGNNQTPYKNWDAYNWISLLQYLAEKLPAFKIVILGDTHEMAINPLIDEAKLKNVFSLIGKTSIEEAVSISAKAAFYIGLDSVFMHLAFALNKPTFSIWGASNPQLYGYPWKDEKKHAVVSQYLDCAPCNAWIGANTSRVKSPLACPDFKCITTLRPATVIAALEWFIIENKFYNPNKK